MCKFISTLPQRCLAFDSVLLAVVAAAAVGDGDAAAAVLDTTDVDGTE